MHPGHQGGFGPRGPGQFGPQHSQWVICSDFCLILSHRI